MNDSFIHITDLHFWELIRNPLRLLNKRALGNINIIMKRRHEFIMDNAWNHLEYINSLKTKNVIITGDIASTATPFEFKQGAKFIQQLEDAGKKVTVIPGNHDVYTFKSANSKEFGKHFFQWIPDEPPPCAQPLPGGTPVIYIPTVCPNLISSKGRITDFEIETTLSLVETCPSPVIVAGHYPLLNKTKAYTATPNRQLRNVHKLRTALGRTGKDILYICGHVHRFSDTIDPQYPNLRHLTTGALFRTAHESNADGDFSVIEIEKSNINITRHLHQNGNWTAQ